MISVIMSTYKESEKFLRESIESILQQTYQDFEFIIILDYPENQEHIRIINEYKEKDSRIQFYINEKNKGLTDSLNTALTYIRGEYVARMDADDIACKDRFEKQIKYLQENDYDLIGGITRMINEDGKTLYSISKVPSDYNKIKKSLDIINVLHILHG